MPTRPGSFLAAGLLALTLGSCGGRDIAELRREEQFVITLGRLENQIDLFQVQGRRERAPTTLFMRDGTFYISNGGGAKVMEFSSYGDLLLLLYDPAFNPDPVGLSVVGEEGGVASTKRAVRHTLPEVGAIVVDGDQTVYLAARANETLAVQDEKLGVRREGVVLRFDREGVALPYLGMDGVGGTPFPPIESMTLTSRNELVVVSRTAQERIILWFSPDGELRYKTLLSERQVPAPAAGTADDLRVIQHIAPDQNQAALFVLVDYFRETEDRATGTSTAVVPLTSVLYRLNLQTSEWDRSHELPAVRNRKVKSSGREVEIPGSRYELLGMVRQGYAFLLRHDGSGVYELAVLDGGGRLAERRRLYIDDQGLTSVAFHLSSEGILTALLADSTKAQVVWWRCDQIIGPGLR